MSDPGHRRNIILAFKGLTSHQLGYTADGPAEDGVSVLWHTFLEFLLQVSAAPLIIAQQ